MLNEHLDSIEGNIYNINEFCSQFENAMSNKRLLISPNRPNEIIFDESIFLDLNNENLINELFSYKMKSKRYNSDSLSINRLVEFFMTALQQKSIQPDDYMNNLKICVKYLKDIGESQVALLSKTKYLLSIARVRIKNDKPLNIRKLNIFIRGRKKIKDFNSMVNAELKLLEAEIDDVKKKSKEFISKYNKNR